MKDEQVTEEIFDSPEESKELALPGDTIRKRHIATRASNRRKILVYVLGDSEFEGYSIGLDEHSLQILELPSGDVSTIALNHIVSITDSKPFNELSKEMKDIVDRRTASFRKASQTWIVAKWPKTYDRRDEDTSYQNRNRFARPNRINLGSGAVVSYSPATTSRPIEELNSDADS